MKKIADKDVQNLKKLVNWFFEKDTNQSICIAFYRKNYSDDMHISINSIHGQELKKLTSKEAEGETFSEVLKNYAKQV